MNTELLASDSDKLSFDNTTIAFKNMSNSDLKRANFLFSIVNFPLLTKIGFPLLNWALKMGFPLQSIIKKTIFKHFCGGENLEEVKLVVDVLKKYEVKAILDYGVEAKQNESDFDQTKIFLLDTIKYAMVEPNINIISSKLTGLIRLELLEKVSANKELNSKEQQEYERGLERVREICKAAHQNDIQVYFDAEESWIQDAVDEIVTEMMKQYNSDKPIVFNTIQLYLKDRLQFLKDAYQKSLSDDYILAIKLVRGAYMEKEADRAEELNYENPVQNSKSDTDRDFNDAIKFCMQHLGEMAVCCASHNEESNLLLADLIDKSDLANDHPLISFAQLYGMSDYMTFNLANRGYYACKYLPYGPVKEVIPYLLRRAEENSSIDGQMGKELKFIRREIKRRKNLN